MTATPGRIAPKYLPCQHLSEGWCWPCVQWIDNQAFNNALIEAAGVAKNFTVCFHGENCPTSECDCGVDIAQEIEALKGHMKETHSCQWMIERRSRHHANGIQCNRPANYVQFIPGDAKRNIQEQKRHLCDAHMSYLAAIKSAG